MKKFVQRMKMGVSDNESLLDRVTECDMRGEDDDLEFRIQEKHEEDEDILSRKVPSSSAGEKTESMELSPGEISVDNEDNSERITFTPNQIHPLANHVVRKQCGNSIDFWLFCFSLLRKGSSQI